jgi:hypothetical protein
VFFGCSEYYFLEEIVQARTCAHTPTAKTYSEARAPRKVTWEFRNVVFFVVHSEGHILHFRVPFAESPVLAFRVVDLLGNNADLCTGRILNFNAERAEVL